MINRLPCRTGRALGVAERFVSTAEGRINAGEEGTSVQTGRNRWWTGPGEDWATIKLRRVFRNCRRELHAKALSVKLKSWCSGLACQSCG